MHEAGPPLSERVRRRSEALRDEADQAIARSDWPQVQDRAQNVLALDPENGDARTFLAAARRALEGASAGVGQTASREEVAGAGESPSSEAATAEPASFCD